MGTTTMERRMPRAGPSPGGRRRGRLMGHEVRELLRLAGPIIVGQLGGVAMTTTDTIMVAPLGAASLAAAGLGSGIHFTSVVALSGMLMGMTPLVSQSFGAGDRAECRRVAVQGLWLAALISIPIIALSLSGRAVSLWLGQEPHVAALAGAFMVALAPGVLPLLLFMALRVYLDAMGRTRVAMTIMFVGVAVNAVGNRILIYGVPGMVRPMAVVGSGLSTSIVRWAMLAVMAAYVARHPELSPFRGARLRPVAERMRRIAAIGMPIGAQLGAEVGTFAFAGVMMGWLGPVQLASHQVTINIASATFMVAVGASAAGGIRVGHHLGAGSRRGVRRAGLATYGVTLGFMSLCALVFLTFPRGLIGLYTRDPQIVAYGTSLLFMAALFQVFDGAQVAGLSLLRGAADTRVPMWITLGGYWGVGMPVAYLLGFHTAMRHVGVWSGLVLSLAVVGVTLAWRVRRVLWSPALAAVVPARRDAVELARAESAAELAADAGAPVAPVAAD